MAENLEELHWTPFKHRIEENRIILLLFKLYFFCITSKLKFYKHYDSYLWHTDTKEI